MSTRAPGGLILLLMAAACPAEQRADPAPSKTQEPDPGPWLDGANVRVFGRFDQRKPAAAVGHYLGAGAVHGVGRLAGDQGMLTFDDGVLWVSRAEAGVVRTQRYEAGDPMAAQASVLGVAQVRDWWSTTVPTLIRAADLAWLVRGAAEEAGCDRGGRLPFRVQGLLATASFSVGSNGLETRRDVRGRLIGVLAEDLAGVLMRPGASARVHITVDAPPAVTGHLRSFIVAQGARLSVPACRPREGRPPSL